MKCTDCPIYYLLLASWRLTVAAAACVTQANCRCCCLCCSCFVAVVVSRQRPRPVASQQAPLTPQWARSATGPSWRLLLLLSSQRHSSTSVSTMRTPRVRSNSGRFHQQAQHRQTPRCWQQRPQAFRCSLIVTGLKMRRRRRRRRRSLRHWRPPEPSGRATATSATTSGRKGVRRAATAPQANETLGYSWRSRRRHRSGMTHSSRPTCGWSSMTTRRRRMRRTVAAK